MELISREEVLNILNDICNHALKVYDKKYHLPIRTITSTAIEDIKILPSQTYDEVEPFESRQKGYWIAYVENNTPVMLRCSMCAHSVVWGSVAKYCPNCGVAMKSDMRGDG